MGHFSSLVNVNFERNYLTEIKRSNFPRPASELEYIDLNQNQIRFIPEDLFTDMPKLKSLDISINQISVLPEQTFKPVFTSLDRLIVIGLPFTCDCRLSWIKPQWKERKSLMLVEWHESSRAENLPILLGDGFQTSRLKI
ncbi:uncharacterized protein LOC143254145 isoform X2 [Tachypleus tridentatus]|uniref:uncharacterized protein LOC143254145 isoform X2 n=1 Tax=Tachypleus tridentatus TaxID=6853 RepID=UPI003FD690B4